MCSGVGILELIELSYYSITIMMSEVSIIFLFICLICNWFLVGPCYNILFNCVNIQISKELIDYRLFIKVDPKLKVNTQANVSVTFTNPLPTRLTGVVITLEGPGLATPVVKKVK